MHIHTDEYTSLTDAQMQWHEWQTRREIEPHSLWDSLIDAVRAALSKWGVL